MKCLETRSKNGLRWRRYRTDDGRIVTTYEMPTQVLLSVTTMKRVAARLEAFKRGQARAELRQKVRERLAAGWKPVAIANELPMSVRNIEKIRSEQ